MNQRTERFGDQDRDQVIHAILECCGVQLERVGSRSKWLREASGKNWWILGGRGTWHGIPKDMMRDERQARTAGVLVIAIKKQASIDVFKGPLGPLVSNRDRLRRGDDQFHFNVKVDGTRMRCVEAPNVVLDKLVTIPYCAEDRERDKRLNEILKLTSTMSREERAAVMSELARLLHCGSAEGSRSHR